MLEIVESTEDELAASVDADLRLETISYNRLWHESKSKLVPILQKVLKNKSMIISPYSYITT